MNARQAQSAVKRDVFASRCRSGHNVLLTEAGLGAGRVAELGIAEGLQEGQHKGVAIVAALLIASNGPAR